MTLLRGLVTNGSLLRIAPAAVHTATSKVDLFIVTDSNRFTETVQRHKRNLRRASYTFHKVFSFAPNVRRCSELFTIPLVSYKVDTNL